MKRPHRCGPRILCGAKLQKHPGRYCRRWAMMGKRRCPIHGGRGNSAPRPRYDDDGNYIVTNLEARNAGLKRHLERRRLIKAAMKACEPPKPVNPKPKNYEAFRAAHARWCASRRVQSLPSSE